MRKLEYGIFGDNRL